MLVEALLQQVQVGTTHIEPYLKFTQMAFYYIYTYLYLFTCILIIFISLLFILLHSVATGVATGAATGWNDRTTGTGWRCIFAPGMAADIG